MASDLPAFELWTTCVKCDAWDDHDVKYETPDHWYAYNAANERVLQSTGDGEWLLRTCRRCEYSWKEACVDA